MVRVDSYDDRSKAELRSHRVQVLSQACSARLNVLEMIRLSLSVNHVQWLSERAVPQEQMERDRRAVVFCQVGWDAIHGHVATNPNPACPGLDGVEDVAAVRRV
jgi:hypothetical protein